MGETDDLRQRMEKLEELVAFQDRTVEELSGTVAEQWKQIEVLRRELSSLGAQLADVEAGMPGPQREPPPPHY